MKLKVQNEAELEEIIDLEADDWRQKRLLTKADLKFIILVY